MKKYLGFFLLMQIVMTASGQYLFEEIATTQGISATGDAGKLPVSFNNKLYFSGSVAYNDGGAELFQYEGSSVTLFADINTPGHSYPGDLFAVADDYFLFTATTAAAGRELYASDGNTAWMLKDIHPGSASGLENGGNDYFQYVLLNGKVYFFARENGDGFDLWRTDGTASGTEKVADLNAFNVGIKGSIIVFDNAIYFTMSVDGSSDMYKYEDSGNTVTKVFDVNPVGPSAPSQYTILENNLFFTASNSLSNREWYYTNGSDTPTVIDLNGPLSTNPSSPFVYNNKLYFVGAVSTSNNRDPYVIAYHPDSLAYEATLLKDFVQGPLNGTVLGTSSQFVPFGGDLYFAAREFGVDDNLWQLYKTDGTPPGTVHAVTITTTHTGGLIDNEIRGLLTYNDKLFFNMSATPFGDYQLWETDGSAYDLNRLSNNGVNMPEKAYLNNALLHNNSLVFRGFSSAFPYDYELWTITGDVNLPLELLDFNAKRIAEDQVQLNWETTYKENASHYEIEAGVDGKVFQTIGRVTAYSNNVIEGDYRFVDRYPKPGINYYRLKQVDHDGKWNYTRIASVWITSSMQIQVYPNPASNVLLINTFGHPFENGTVAIINSDGRTVREERLRDDQTRMDISALVAGNYMIRIVSTVGEVYTTKFVKR